MVEVSGSKICILSTKPYQASIILLLPYFNSLHWIHGRCLINTYMIDVKIKNVFKLLSKVTAHRGGSRIRIHPFLSFLGHCSVHCFLTCRHLSLTLTIYPLVRAFRNCMGSGIFRDLLTKLFNAWNFPLVECWRSILWTEEKKKEAILNVAERVWAKSIWQTDYFFRSKTHQAL